MKITNQIVMKDLQSKWLTIVALSLVVSACVMAHEATWKTVPESNMPYDRAWSIVVNAITQHFELETSDAQSGYLRTGWKVTGKDILGAPIKKARVHVRVEEKNPFRVKVKVEKQEFDAFSEEWVITGNDEKMESEIMGELSGRLSRG
jgi:methionine-rich copper-binding protein CopC